MATYKLIQDIEAEDKILGPLTLRQFIFALISVFLFYICFILVENKVAFLLVLFLPPALFFGFFALPFGRDQPTEIWALAKLRYYFKPRKRVWNQSGVKELVTVTAPKRVERIVTNGLSQTEVKSRLRALADTIDSRGWAVKNVAVNAYSAPSLMPTGSDRLLEMENMPREVPTDDIVAADDILDETSNPIAQQFDSMISQSTKAHRQDLINKMNDTGLPQPPSTQNDYWFMKNQPASSSVPVPAVEAAHVDPAEEASLVSQLKTKAASHPAPYGNLRTLRPSSDTPPSPQIPLENSQAQAVTPPTDPAIISLSENDDLNVATLAREAKRVKDGDNQDEVVVSLR